MLVRRAAFSANGRERAVRKNNVIGVNQARTSQDDAGFFMPQKKPPTRSSGAAIGISDSLKSPAQRYKKAAHYAASGPQLP